MLPRVISVTPVIISRMGNGAFKPGFDSKRNVIASSRGHIRSWPLHNVLHAASPVRRTNLGASKRNTCCAGASLPVDVATAAALVDATSVAMRCAAAIMFNTIPKHSEKKSEIASPCLELCSSVMSRSSMFCGIGANTSLLHELLLTLYTRGEGERVQDT